MKLRPRLISIPLLLALASCASPKIEEAIVLGKAGKEIAENAQKPLASMRSRLVMDLDAALISSAVTGIPRPSDVEIKARDGIIASTQKREKALQQLQETYDSFLDLAGYKAGEIIGNDVKNLADSVAKLAAIAGSSPPASGVSQALQAGAQAITEKIQLEMLREASAGIRSFVNAFQGVMLEEKTARKSDLDRLSKDRLSRLDRMIAKNQSAAKPLIKEALVADGLEANDETVAKFFSSEGEAGKEVLLLREKRKSEQRDKQLLSLYDAAVLALKKLEVAHLQFESANTMKADAIVEQATALVKALEAFERTAK